MSIIKLRVQVNGIVEGNPPMLAFTKMLQRPDGKRKLHSQMVQVTDAALLERLSLEIKNEEEADVVLETYLSSESASVVLKKFASVNARLFRSEDRLRRGGIPFTKACMWP